MPPPASFSLPRRRGKHHCFFRHPSSSVAAGLLKRRLGESLLNTRIVIPRATLAILFFWTPLLMAQPAQPAAPAPAPPAGLHMVGSDECKLCHEEIYASFQKSRHHTIGSGKTSKWKGNACEACHGPGSKHIDSSAAEDIRQPAKLAARESEQVCLTCHTNQQSQVGRIQGGHGRNQVACTGCHSFHQPGEPLRVKNPAGAGVAISRDARINETCANCHTAQWAQFQKPHHHKLPEGAMSCADCHNPHGSARTASIRMVNANEPNCFRCHGDKRGPFTFEHAAVRLDGCGACHEPHGSANPKMLTRHEERFVCLECHANVGVRPTTPPTSSLGGVPPAFHDLRSPQFRVCSTCHVKVHGSHTDRAFLK